MKLGDIVHKVARPIAQGIDGVFHTNVENCESCAERRQRLNNFSDKFFDRFWSKSNKGENTMYFTVQIAVEAEDVRAAVSPEAISTGTIISVNPRSPMAVARPQPQKPAEAK